MEPRLSRVLRWLGLTQPNGSVGAGTPLAGTPFQAMDSMARKGQQTNWAACAADVECPGASAGPEGHCLAHLASHLDDADFAAKLERLVREESLDARGVHFTEDLLERLLGACPKNEAQAPVFEGVVRFDQATFKGKVNFEGAIFRESAVFDRATFKRMAEFGEATFEKDAGFHGATFEGLARFTEATFVGFAEFGQTSFEKDARFRATRFKDVARFSEATFAGFAEFGHATVAKDARFRAAAFERAGIGPLIAKELVLDGAVFRQRPELEVATGYLSCHETRFLDGAYLRLRWAKVVLEDADFAGPSILTGAPDFKDEQFRQTESEQVKNWPSDLSEEPCIVSLRRSNVGGLALSY